MALSQSDRTSMHDFLRKLEQELSRLMDAKPKASVAPTSRQTLGECLNLVKQLRSLVARAEQKESAAVPSLPPSPTPPPAALVSTAGHILQILRENTEPIDWKTLAARAASHGIDEDELRDLLKRLRQGGRVRTIAAVAGGVLYQLRDAHTPRDRETTP